MALDSVANCGRGCLMTLNSFFGLLALGMAVVGMLVKFAKDVINSIVGKLFDTVASMTGGMGGVDLSSLDITALVGNAAIGLVVIGITLAVVAGMGIFGAKQKIKPLLILYGIMLILVVFVEVAFIVVLITMRDMIDGYMKPSLRNFLKDRYVGGNGTDVLSLAFDFFMSGLSCCGMEDFSDFNESLVWDREYFYVDDLNVTLSVTLTTPVSCCKEPREMAGGGDCAVTPTEENSNYLTGCYTALWTIIENQNAISFGFLGTLGVFELTLIFFSFWLMRAVLKEEKEKKKKKEEEDEMESEEDEELQQATELLNEIGLALPTSSEESSPNTEKNGESKNKSKKSQSESTNNENSTKNSNNSQSSNKNNRNDKNSEIQTNNSNQNKESAPRNSKDNNDRAHALTSLVRNLIGNTEATNTQNSTISALMGGLANRINNNPALQLRQGQIPSIKSLVPNINPALQPRQGQIPSIQSLVQNLDQPQAQNNLGGIFGNMMMQQQLQTPQPFQNYPQMNYSMPGISYPLQAQPNDFMAYDGYQMNSGQFYPPYPIHSNYYQSYNPHVPPPQPPVYPPTQTHRYPATLLGGHPPPLIYEPPPYFRPGVDVSTNTTQSEALPSGTDDVTTTNPYTRCGDRSHINCSDVQFTHAPGRSKLHRPRRSREERISTAATPNPSNNLESFRNDEKPATCYSAGSQSSSSRESEESDTETSERKREAITRGGPTRPLLRDITREGHFSRSTGMLELRKYDRVVGELTETRMRSTSMNDSDRGLSSARSPPLL